MFNYRDRDILWCSLLLNMVLTKYGKKWELVCRLRPDVSSEGDWKDKNRLKKGLLTHMWHNRKVFVITSSNPTDATSKDVRKSKIGCDL